MYNVTLPELGEGIETAMVAFWHCKVGDQIKKDDEIVELVTDKATFNVTADKDGILKEILVTEGQEAKIGATLAVVE